MAFAIITNTLMMLVVVVSVLLQLAVIYLPFTKSFFKLVPLPNEDLQISVAADSLEFIVIKVVKKFFGR
ncbi:cation transporting ATPase C-terminal domain-containing protein [Pontibacter harenae]|uniref:cation transporting ATPase C-terminal domain-containing protein n=1 Tax=Pontibacter harenae TaxID=2894083 RepID=UPI0034E1E57D